MKKTTLSDEEKLALTYAKNINGRNWKAMLRAAWMSGDYSDYADWAVQPLQYLRNASYFGPEGLAKW